MINWRTNWRTFASGLLALPFLISSAQADVMLFDRGLPTANLNDAAGANRSNVSWGFAAPYDQYFTGDNFTLSASPGVTGYVVNTLRVWTAVGANSSFDFEQSYDKLKLFGGADGSGVSLLSSGEFEGGTALDNSNIHITPVTYAGGSNYQGTAANYQLWQVDFTNLNWLITPGQLMNFGVMGVLGDDDPNLIWVNHASNAALSGSPQDGADNQYLVFDSTALTDPFVFNSDPNFDGGFDKSSDINVQIFGSARNGSAVPEPASFLLLGTLIAASGLAIRKKRV